MGITVLYQLKHSEQNIYPTGNFVFWLVGATYFLTLLYSVLFSYVENFTRFIELQLAGDLLLISLLVSTTGFQESLFLFCYLLVIIAAAVLLYRRGSLIFATGSLVSLIILLLIGWQEELLRGWSFIQLPATPLDWTQFAYISTVYGSAFYMMAMLASHLSEQVRETEEILFQQQINLSNLEVLHHDIIRSLSSGLITTDSLGKVQFYNESANRILGLKRSNLLGTALHELFGIPGDTAQKGKGIRLETQFQTPKGEDKILGMTLSELQDRHQQKVGELLLFQDLTPLKKMEEATRHNEKMAAVGELAAGLAHEIRNPLASLFGATQLLQAELSLDEEQMSLMAIVSRETERLNQLLSEFLLFARPQKPQQESQELAKLIQETLFLFAQDHRCHHVRVVEDIPEELLAYVDRKLFHQMLWNLLLNAADAMRPDGGEIKLQAAEVDDGFLLEIEDQGTGIDDKFKSKVFEPFFSTKERGTGLGLAVVQRIIKEHNGTLDIESEKGSFTRFKLFFPSRSEDQAFEEKEKDS